MKLPVLEKSYIHRENLLWLLVAQAFSILPLLFYLPPWLCFFWFFAVVWRIQIYRMKWGYPNAISKILLGGLCAVAVYISFNGVGSSEPMVAFLVCAFVLKTVEMHTKKDALVILFISFVAIACQFLFDQGIGAGIYGFFSLFILLTAWQAAFFSRQLSVKSYLKRGGILVLQSLPFMVVLFVIMPRIGPLWSVPLPQYQGKTGFSDSLRMGDIGSLVQSHQVAFRVSFYGLPPKVEQLYWRGLILDYFDGFEWRAHDYSAKNKLPKPSVESIPELLAKRNFEYSIILEPHSYRWLFALKEPIAVESSQLAVFSSDEGMLASRDPVVQKSEYRVISSLQSDSTNSSASRALSLDQIEQFTLLPEGMNNRTKALGEQWRNQYVTTEEIMQAALDYYHASFSYTLQPSVLGRNPVDQFLFESQNGFCEHFASSFVYLMRSAGIPSRVVLGYMGASYNELDDYYVVKQSNAHAWAEVWVSGRWRTVDPTAAVAPSRVSLGLEQALSEADLAFVGSSIWQSQLLMGAYQRWDSLGYSWNRWVLNYDSKNQEGLIKKLLGNTSPWRVGLAFMGFCAFIFLTYAWLQYRSKLKKYVSPEDKLLRPVLRRLARKGFVRTPSESINQFSARILLENTLLGQSFQKIAKAYTASVYSGNSKSLQILKTAIRLAK